jgi:hypothetical protein
MIASKTVYDLLFSSLRRVGIVALGDTVDDDVIQEALLELNALRAEWSINTRNYKQYDEVYTATENKQFVTLGTSDIIAGDFPVRPNSIDQVTIISGQPGAGINYPVTIFAYEMYSQLAIQNIFSIPTNAYVDSNFPLQRIYLYPGITAGYSIRVQGLSYMTEYEQPSDSFLDPQEYWSPLDLVLTLRLAVKYGMVLPEGVVIQANSALKHIESKLFGMRLKPARNNTRSGRNGTGFSFFAGV